MVAVNNADTAQTVTVDTWSAGATFTGIYGVRAPDRPVPTAR